MLIDVVLSFVIGCIYFLLISVERLNSIARDVEFFLPSLYVMVVFAARVILSQLVLRAFE